jgi:hypothetical protein
MSAETGFTTMSSTASLDERKIANALTETNYYPKAGLLPETPLLRKDALYGIVSSFPQPLLPRSFPFHRKLFCLRNNKGDA